MASKKGGKEASPEDIMSVADMKMILATAKHGALPACVIGLTKDKDGVVMLDKKKKPKQLVALLKKSAAEAGLELEMPSLRFGRASVDADEGAGLLTFTVNKEAPGALRPKILMLVKKAGFNAVEITIDAGLENEPEEAVEGETQEEPAPNVAATAPPPPPEAAPQRDDTAAQLAALTAELTGLVKRMMPLIAADPGRQATLRGMAVQAQTAIKSGNVDDAKTVVVSLQNTIETFEQAQPSEPANGGGAGNVEPAIIMKARDAWVATRKRIEADIQKLSTAIDQAYDGSTEVKKHVKPLLDSVLAGLGTKLSDKLDEVANASAADRSTLISEAKQIIAAYQNHVASDKVVTMLDDNPFVPISVQKTVSVTLAALSRSIH